MITTILGGTAIGAGAIGIVYGIRGALLPAGRHRAGHPQAPAGVVATGWRYCPEELRQRAAVVHPDGSATCADCDTHIPSAIAEAPRA